MRFHEAAAQQTQQLNDISANIHTGGVQYTATDDDQAGALSDRHGLRHGRLVAPSTDQSIDLTETEIRHD